VQTGNGTEHRR